MKLETFFERFDQLADVPGAVEKMRELVLGLAVHGKLVEQFASEGSADSLIEALRLARRQDGCGKASEDVQADELPRIEGWHPIPVSWRWVKLGTIGDIVGGGTPRSDNPAYFASTGIPWLTPADLNGLRGKTIFRGRRCITKAGLEDSSARLLPAGSVLFSSRAPIGYVAIAGNELATNQGFKSCVPFIGGLSEFIYYYLLSVAPRIDREASGTTFREVSGKIVSQIPVPLPPLAEQKRIVAKVDELMALCDRLEEQHEDREARHRALARASLARFAEAPTLDNLPFLFHQSYSIAPADLRRSILALAIRGKLSVQDHNDEAAADLLRAIEVEKKILVSEGLIKPTGRVNQSPDQPIGFQPPKWQLASLAELCVAVTDGDHLPPPKAAKGVPFLVISNVRWGDINFEGCRHVTEEYYDRLEWIRKPRAGDILYTLVGSFGIPVLVQTERPFCVQRHIGILRPSHHLERRYLAYALASDAVFQQASAVATGIAQKTVPLAGLRKITIPVPPLAEQRRIVAKVDQLMTLVDQLEHQLAAFRVVGASLLGAVVASLTSLNGGGDEA